MLNKEQKKILNQYGVYSGDDIDRVLEELENKILEVGFTKNWETLNSTGGKLQRLYDEIYVQEDDGES